MVVHVLVVVPVGGIDYRHMPAFCAFVRAPQYEAERRRADGLVEDLKVAKEHNIIVVSHVNATTLRGEPGRRRCGVLALVALPWYSLGQGAPRLL